MNFSLAFEKLTRTLRIVLIGISLPIILFYIVMFSYYSFESYETQLFLNQIRIKAEANPSGFYLRDTTDFKWNKVCIYPEGWLNKNVSKEKITEETNIKISSDFEAPNMRASFFKNKFLFIFNTEDGVKYFLLKKGSIKINKINYSFMLPGDVVHVFCANEDAFIKRDIDYLSIN